MPDGTIIQWGQIPVASYGNTPINFKVPFKKYVSGISITRVTDYGAATVTPVLLKSSVSLTGFKVYCNGVSYSDVSWIAIGR